MPGQRTVWGIDLGQCALKAIKLSFDSTADRAVAEAFDYIEHPKILSQPDADPDELIRSALEKFLSRNNVKDSAVYVSVPGQAGLARFVKLPPVEAKKIPDIVKFEAKQQIPFSLDDVVWDYQRTGGGDEEEGFVLETEVGIFAIKKDMAHRHLVPFTGLGIEVDVIQLAPLALYNFAAFDHFYHGQAKKEGAEGEGATTEETADEGDTLVVIDIGADKTDVVITDGDSIWLRNLPIGGNHFTRALTKELKLTFAKAEHLKRNATKAPDPKKLYQAMRPVFQDFVSELQRSIGYFSSTHRNRVIKTVLGMGNGFKLPGLQKFLEQNLQYQVAKVDAFRGMGGDEVLSSRAFTDNLLSFAVAYGLALQGLHQTPIQTSLLPREIQTARLVRAKKPWSLTAAACLLFGLATMFGGNYFVLDAVKSEEFSAKMEGAKGAVSQFQKWDSEFKSAQSKFGDQKTKGESIVGLKEVENRLGWIKVFKVVNQAIPPRAAKADEFNIEEIGEVNVEGVYAAYLPDVANWFTSLPDAAKNTLDAKDKENAPSGPGWVFQVLGYTFHGDYEIFVQDEVLRKGFQADRMRSEGISHAVLYWREVDDQWKPGSASKLEKQPRVTELARSWGGGAELRAGGAAGLAGMAGGTSAGMSTGMEQYMQQSSRMGGGMGGMAGMSGLGMEEGMMENYLTSDFQSYQAMSAMGFGGAYGPGGGMPQTEELTLMRTDFEIHFLWQPDKKKSESDGSTTPKP